MDELRGIDTMFGFAPEGVQPRLHELYAELLLLYECDRHYEFLDVAKEMLRVLDQATDELTKQPERSISACLDSVESTVPVPSIFATQMIRNALLRSKEYHTATLKCKECNIFLQDIKHDTTVWSPISVDKKGYGTYSRDQPGCVTQSIKVMGEVDVPMIHMAGVVMELDLYTEWFPFCIEAKDQGIVSRFHRTSKFAITIPWPVANREVFIVGYAIDDMTRNKRVIIYARSVKDGEQMPPMVRIPGVTKGNVRADLNIGGFLIELLTPERCLVSFILNINPNLSAIPPGLMNFVSGRLMWVLLHEMQKAAVRSRKPDGAYAERRKQHKQIYAYFEARAQEIIKLHFDGGQI